MFYAMQTTAPSTKADLIPYVAALRSEGPVTTIPLPHVVHSIHTGWMQSKAQPSPTLPLEIKIDKAAYADLQLPVPTTSLRNSRIKSQRSCADTGAQLFTVPTSILGPLGLKEVDLFPVATNLNTVTGTPVDIIGGILLILTGTNPYTGVVRSSRQLAYVSRTVPYPFLSKEACLDLGLIPATFPAIGSCDTQAATLAAVSPHPDLHSPACSNSVVTGPEEPPCSCPLRQLPPTTPPTLPCEPIPANLPLIKAYILSRYAASAFNICKRQPLPLMKDSPPMRLFMDKDAKPVAVHTPAPIPVHWASQVKAGLDRDIRLGVLERVPVNEPTSWCSRMIITPKHDGSPRRVIDYQPVNDHCPRQTHHTRSPWQVASSVPRNTVKSICDAWHGYHSVPIHPANFESTCTFLDKCSLGGIVFNPKKFVFAEEEVDYLGFRLTKEGLKPTSEFLNNIRSFPSPKSLTDVRSWYGAINQISYSFASSQAMLPFRQLLRPQVPFYWSEELEAIFVESKEEILRQCQKGVKLYDMSLPTGLATDWSKSCMGFWLVQKHCSCPGTPTLACCKSGWQTVYCGSRFNSGAESRYHPIEGEAAAAVHGLDKTSMFALGHPSLMLALDHKPLIKIFGDAALESITNPRLFNFKQKTLKYRFRTVHVPGKKNVVPDTFSRRSDTSDQESHSNVLPAYSDTMGPPDWVSFPATASYTIASYSTPNHLEDETEAFVLGLAMSRLEEFNNPPELLAASITAPAIQAITWPMLESAWSLPRLPAAPLSHPDRTLPVQQGLGPEAPPLLPSQAAAHHHRPRHPHQRQAGHTQIPEAQSH